MSRILKVCSKHGEYRHVLEKNGYYRCIRCRNDHVIEYRRQKKISLILESGGRCKLCGYNKHVGALQFHHLDPQKKQFGISHRGLTRSISRSREEVKKCILLCANCHQEVEDGVAKIPIEASE